MIGESRGIKRDRVMYLLYDLGLHIEYLNYIDHRARISFYQKKIGELKTEIMNIKSNYKDAITDVSAAKAKVTELRMEIDQKDTMLKAKEKKLKDQADELHESMALCRDREIELNKKYGLLNRSQMNYQKLLDEKVSLEQESVNLKTEIVDLKQEIVDLKQRLKAEADKDKDDIVLREEQISDRRSHSRIQRRAMYNASDSMSRSHVESSQISEEYHGVHDGYRSSRRRYNPLEGDRVKSDANVDRRDRSERRNRNNLLDIIQGHQGGSLHLHL